MFGNAEKIFAVYENPQAVDPADRAVLVRDGFAFWVFALGGVWLLCKRLWLVLLGYVMVQIALSVLLEAVHAAPMVALAWQVWFQLMLAFQVGDMQGWLLKRRGYHFAGVVVAESNVKAQLRYYEHAVAA